MNKKNRDKILDLLGKIPTFLASIFLLVAAGKLIIIEESRKIPRRG